MRFVYIFFLMIYLFWGCTGSPENSTENKNSNHYAKGFRIEKNKKITKLTVFNPWGKAQNVKVEYFLIPGNDEIPDSLFGKNIIKTPVEKVVCLSTTHLAFLEILDETDAVAGVSGSQYVSNEKIRTKIDANKIPDVGYGQNLNYEVIVNQKPDLVMVYGVGSEVTSHTQKLEELGIPVIMVAEYLEETPLGKAEWIRFIGTLFQKEKKANEFFRLVEEDYNLLKSKAAKVKSKPDVMVGSPYKDSWWVPGGKSYLANLIKDAGGSYLGHENPSHESYVISFENALLLGNQAEVWINMGNLASKKEILSADQRFENFAVFKEGKIYNNIKRLSKQGGNDFWESGTVNPHLVLRDLITIFHPALIQEDLVYYQQLN